jgi:hypothetical protein
MTAHQTQSPEPARTPTSICWLHDSDSSIRSDDSDSPRQRDHRLRRASTTGDKKSGELLDATTAARQPKPEPRRPRQNCDRRRQGAGRTGSTPAPNLSPSVAAPETSQPNEDHDYRAQADRPATDPLPVHIELPDHDPAITPGAAAALLRLILNAAGRGLGTDDPSVSRSTR